MVLRIAARAQTHVALLELLVPDQDLRHDGRPVLDDRLAGLRHRGEPFFDEGAHARVVEVADGGNNQVWGGVGVREIVAQDVGVQRLDRVRTPENRPAQRVIFPEALREELVHEVVRRVLDHLDLFEDHLLLALDVARAERRIQHDVRQDVHRQRQVLVQHLDVVAGVFLGRERIELPANGVDRLRDVLGGPRRRSLEQHVLDEVRDAAALGRLVARPTGQPHADADGADLGHLLGEKTEAVVEYVSDDNW